jgi:acetylornithine/succinyldiaminopimelate/putrescine aminotransferase
LPGVVFATYNQESDLHLITEETAAIVIEIVQAESGYISGQNDFLQAVQDRCRAMGTLVIIDEIQTGCGRTGSMFAFEQSPLTPDILLLAKGFGGGMPIGAFIARKEVMHTLSIEPILGHLTTFGGHPVNCAAALANLEVIEAENLCSKATVLGAKIREELERHGLKVSGKGMMLAVQTPDFNHCHRRMISCLEQGLIVDWFLYAPHCIRISPPLNISEATVNKALDILTQPN